MKTLRSFLVVFSAFIFILSGCAHIPLKEQSDPKLLFQRACTPGTMVASASGQVWIDAKSTDSSGGQSGKFPADAKVVAPSTLDLEVTNLLGGTEAMIHVRGNRYEIKVPKSPEKSAEGKDYWGGIPLRWATDLFVGRIPCPNLKPGDPGLTLTVEGEGELVAVAGGERFVYHFREYAGKAWPEHLVWSAKENQQDISFDFENPEETTQSPLQWQAKSKTGEVKVRWKNRRIKSTEPR